MKYTAANHHLLYLTANQISSFNRVFIVNRHYEMGEDAHKNYDNPDDYQVYINPKIIEEKGAY